MLNVLDLFSGIGGFSLGLERTGGFKTVAFCEIEPFCQKVLKKHWPNVPIYEDVRTLTAERLKADGITVDVICGGFPCQDISTAGKGAGIEGERSGLWSEYARIIGELRPQYVIVENVAALLGRGMGRVLGDLSKFGYDAEWENIPAATMGAPHLRERIWIVGYPSSARQKQYVPMALYGSLELCDGGHNAAWPTTNSSSIGRSGSRRPFQPVNSAACEYWDANKSFYALRWPTQSPIRRRNDGVPVRLDQNRIASLGNAVVPQIPELIGNAILASINDKSSTSEIPDA